MGEYNLTGVVIDLNDNDLRLLRELAEAPVGFASAGIDRSSSDVLLRSGALRNRTPEPL